MLKTVVRILFVAGLASPARAAAPVPPKPGEIMPMTTRVGQPVVRAQFLANIDNNFRTLDANHDGVITIDEIVAAQAKQVKILEAQAIQRRTDLFAKLDINHDGVLSVAEFNAGFPVNPMPLPDPRTAFEKLDTSHDGKVSADEFRAPQLSKFNQIDTNHDGVITPQELQASRRPSR